MRAPMPRWPNCRRPSTPRRRLAAVRTDIEGHRRFAAQVRAEAQALAREAELADRRVQAIIGRAHRMAEPQAERGLAGRHRRGPHHRSDGRARRARQCAGAVRRKAPRADQRNRIRRKRPPRRRRRAGRRRERDGGDRPRSQGLARSALRAREACARAEERMEGTKRRLVRHRARNPRHARSRAARGGGARRDRAGRGIAAARRDRGKPRKAAPRPRAARRRQSARRGRAARGRDPAHRADHRARRPGRSHQAAAPGHPEPQQGSPRAAADLVRDRQRALQAAVHRTVRRRRSGTCI